MKEHLKLSPYVIKRYEAPLETYFFYNVKNKTFWETDYSTGAVVAALDGSLLKSEIYHILSENNPEILFEKIQKKFDETFDFLVKEEFLVYAN